MTETEPIGTVQAWGQPLEEEATRLVVDNISTLTKPIESYSDWNTIVGFSKPNINATTNPEATKKLKTLMRALEDDIAYFQILKGQSLAIHKFATLKHNLLEVVALLEK